MGNAHFFIGDSMNIEEYTLIYKDYKLKFLNIGAAITEFSRDNKNIVLSFKDYSSYRNNVTYMGAIVGRSAGRIRDGQIGNWTLPLNQNNTHNLHGNNLHYRFYDVVTTANKATLTLVDPEGDFPGNAELKVEYELSDNGLTQTISAISDKPTILNLTNHSYFNLSGESILNHKLEIRADKVLKLDKDLLPIDKMDTNGTAFDFNKPRLISDSLEQGDQQFLYSKFIDHPFELKDNIMLFTDKLELEISTDQPYVVVYTSNYLKDEVNELKGEMNADFNAICLETQAAPGSTELVNEYKSITNYNIKLK